MDARIHAAPVPAPPPPLWPRLSAAGDAYRRVVAEGRLLDDRETLVQALTDEGAGYWVLTPLRTTAGFTLLVNRGYVPPEERRPGAHASPPGLVTVTGLLRMTEPNGRLLRANRPDEDRWYSRDVAAIAHARRLVGPAAPYFIDAEAGAGTGPWPREGLTIVTFPNNHLVYALTWGTLALVSAAGFVRVLRGGGRSSA